MIQLNGSRLFFVCCLLFSFALMAEGTKELRPLEADKGSLLIKPDYTSFGLYGASPKEQIKIKVASLDETIYFGFNNQSGYDKNNNGMDQGPFVPNVPFRVLSPSGKVVYSSVMPDLGVPGNIATWSQAVAGPKELGNPNGYNSLQVIPSELGDYVIEFNPLAVNLDRFALPLFDVTVAGPNKAAIPGRLHSEGWQISTQSFENPFQGVMYPYDGETAVYKVDFNGIQPFVFTVNFNSRGTGNTGNFLLDRQSKVGNHTFGEYEIFLNPPDSVLYPTQKKEISLATFATKETCYSSEFCLNFTTNAPGNLDGYIDFNNNGVYDPQNGEVHFSEYITVAGNKCIAWDGKDNKGNLVPTGNFMVRASLGFAPMHLPLYDVEHNTQGYKVTIVRPANATAPKIFWDDALITAGLALDGKQNLTGCLSSATGCHRWRDRGAIKSGVIEQQETINTWWYSDLIYGSQIYSHVLNLPVKLSFDPLKLMRGDTTVCKGDSLSFYIYNDKDHYDSSKYAYQWFFNSQPISSQLRQQGQKMTGDAVIVVVAKDKINGCTSSDTLRVHVVDPIVLRSMATQPPCNVSSGSISVEMLSGPPGKQFFWREFPGNKTGQLSNLHAGVYHLVAKDPAYAGCFADTSFVIKEIGGIGIDTLKASSTLCYKHEGSASVIMEDIHKVYDFSWDGGAFSADSSVTSLSAGSHTVLARDPATGCTDTRPFFIKPLPMKVTIKAKNELCNNHQGAIVVVSSDPTAKVLWSDGSMNFTRDGLAAGQYNFTVTDSDHPTCRLDSAVAILGSSYALQADFDFKPVSGFDTSGGNIFIQFDNLSDPSYSSSWIFGDGTFSKARDPLHLYNAIRDIAATLEVTDSNGCIGFVTKPFAPFRIPFEPCGINMPNAFSPNHDLTNEDIGILGYAPKVELKIFNRWGEVVFRTFEISKKWDGIYRGQEAPVDVYPYILDWQCNSGDGSMSKHRRVGDITLIR